MEITKEHCNKFVEEFLNAFCATDVFIEGEAQNACLDTLINELGTALWQRIQQVISGQLDLRSALIAFLLQDGIPAIVRYVQCRMSSGGVQATMLDAQSSVLGCLNASRAQLDALIKKFLDTVLSGQTGGLGGLLAAIGPELFDFLRQVIPCLLRGGPGTSPPSPPGDTPTEKPIPRCGSQIEDPDFPAAGPGAKEE